MIAHGSPTGLGDQRRHAYEAEQHRPAHRPEEIRLSTPASLSRPLGRPPGAGRRADRRPTRPDLPERLRVLAGQSIHPDTSRQPARVRAKRRQRSGHVRESATRTTRRGYGLGGVPTQTPPAQAPAPPGPAEAPAPGTPALAPPGPAPAPAPGAPVVTPPGPPVGPPVSPGGTAGEVGLVLTGVETVVVTVVVDGFLPLSPEPHAAVSVLRPIAAVTPAATAKRRAIRFSIICQLPNLLRGGQISSGQLPTAARGQAQSHRISSAES